MGCVMPCPLCASAHQVEFSAEMIIHFSGLNNVDKPGVCLFPKLLVCLECGFSRFTIPETKLALLTPDTSKVESFAQVRSVPFDNTLQFPLAQKCQEGV